MSADARASVAIAGEDHAHRVLAARLLDAALVERGAVRGWPDADELDHARVWWSPAPSSPEDGWFYKTTTLAGDLGRVRPRPSRLGRIGDEPAGEAEWFVQLYVFFASQQAAPDVLLGISDSQNQATRQRQARRALDYIRTTLQPTMAVAFGVPHADAECWFVAALTDAPGREAALAELKFDPLQEPERLTAQPNDALRDAKRVLRFLLGQGAATLKDTPTGALGRDEYEELASWSTDDLERLGTYHACGLSDFIADLRTIVAPRIIPGPPP